MNRKTQILFVLVLWLALGCGGRPPSEPLAHFPTLEEARLLARGAPDVELGGEVSVVPSWTVEAPPLLGTGTSSADVDATSARVFDEVRRRRPDATLRTTIAMQCVAREFGRVILQTHAMPDPVFRAFVAGRCGATSQNVGIATRMVQGLAPISPAVPAAPATVEPGADVEAPTTDTESEVATDASEGADVVPGAGSETSEAVGGVAAADAPAPRPRATPAPPASVTADLDHVVAIVGPGPHDVGAAWVSEGTTGIYVVAASPRHNVVSVARTGAGAFILDGRLEGPPAAIIYAFVNRGEYGVEACDPSRRVSPPLFRFRCRMADGDPHALVQIVSLPPDSLVATEEAMLLLHRDDDASLHYAAPSLPDLEGLTRNAASVARALSRYRARAGLPPLVHAEDESIAHEDLSPGMLYASQRRDRQRMERIGLTLMAGWKIEESIRDGGFVLGAAPGRSTAEWLASILAMPIGRKVLLDPTRDAVAVGFAPIEGGTAGVITGYTFFEEGDEAWAARAFSERLVAARAARGVLPPARLNGLSALQQEANRVRTDGVHPRDALDQAMARLQRKITRSVEGVVIEAHHPDALVIPESFLRDGALPYVVAATFHEPEGAAWGQWVFFLVAFR